MYSRRGLIPWLSVIGLWTCLGFHMQANWGPRHGTSNLWSAVSFGSGLGGTEVVQKYAFYGGENVLWTECPAGWKGISIFIEWATGCLTKAKDPIRQVNSQASVHYLDGLDEVSKRSGISKGESLAVSVNVSEIDKLGEPLESVKKVQDIVVSEEVPCKLTGRPVDVYKEEISSEWRRDGDAQDSLMLSPDKNIKIPTGRFFGFSPVINDITVRKLLEPFQQLGWERNSKDLSTCSGGSVFARYVRNKYLVVVLHELSITGAPLSMLELATEIRSCGGRIETVVLNKQGGLLTELQERGIKVLKGKSFYSWSMAAKADLVVVGSAASAAWVGKYLSFNKNAGDHLVWWVMENRREYFDRAKMFLGSVRSIIFLSDLQALLWRNWCILDGLKMPSQVDIVPLSISDELAITSGLDNISVGSSHHCLRELREKFRRHIGVQHNDVLFMTLSSINPGKGQLLLLEAALMMTKKENGSLVGEETVELSMAERLSSDVPKGRRSLDHHNGTEIMNYLDERFAEVSRRVLPYRKVINMAKKKERSSFFPVTSFLKKSYGLPFSIGKKDLNYKIRRSVRPVESTIKCMDCGRLKILIGSLGSKSNKPEYMSKIMRLLHQHPRLAKMVVWVQETTHVAPLYASADAYIMNAQGIGETFGRVTIEAMAFGLPVLATKAGGSREIVEANVTGLLHPVGRAGVQVLAQHMQWLLGHMSLGKKMGFIGKEKVNNVFRRGPMNEKLAKIFMRSHRIVKS